MSLTEWSFLSDDADESEGLGNAGIETYKDAIYASVAREAGQNSADARLEMPLIMKFDAFEIDKRHLPGLEKLTSTVNICFDQCKRENNQKGIDFFKRAKEILSETKVSILHVADYNTKGLEGPCEKGTIFHSLLKGSGISKKESDTSGGSFGIGKNAAFAVSELQTVFYSSQYEDDSGSLTFIAQGKTMLISHTDENGKPRQGRGYWGMPKFKAVTDINLVPEWLRRQERGASIFSVGFRHTEGWQYKMAASLLTNFFPAIHKGEMEFELNNSEIKINKHTIRELFENEKIWRASEENNSKEGLEFAKSLHNCLTSAFTKEFEINIQNLGVISIKILVEEKLPKKIAIIRNGMLITDSLEHFGDKFSRFALAKEFVALIEPLSHNGKALLKNLENPRHDGLSAERIPDERKRKEAEKAMKALVKEIRNLIKNETTTPAEKETTLDELTEFFADDTLKQKSTDPEHEDNLDTIKYQVKTKTRSSGLIPPKGNEPGSKESGGQMQGQQSSNQGTGNKGGDQEGPNEGPNSGAAATDGSDPLNLAKNKNQKLGLFEVRNLVINEIGKIYRRIFFTPSKSCRAQISILATGINDEEELSLVSAINATIERNKAIIDVVEGIRNTIDVELAEDYQGPIEVNAIITQETNEN